MIYSSSTPDIEAIDQLLTSYSFDAETYQTKAVIAEWLAEFGPVWISHAITEALYQGRYKLISVDQILKLWQRRGQPIRHFNREFESIILGQALLCPTGYGDGSDSFTIGDATSPALSESPSVSPAAPESASPGAQLEPDSLVQTELDATDATRAALADQTDALDLTASPETSEAAAAKTRETQPFESRDRSESTSPPTAETHLVVPNFRPVDPDESSAWQQVEVIQPFVPRHDGSELHERLRAVVEGGMGE